MQGIYQEFLNLCKSGPITTPYLPKSSSLMMSFFWLHLHPGSHWPIIHWEQTHRPPFISSISYDFLPLGLYISWSLCIKHFYLILAFFTVNSYMSFRSLFIYHHSHPKAHLPRNVYIIFPLFILTFISLCHNKL